jgi:hypothetical protein
MAEAHYPGERSMCHVDDGPTVGRLNDTGSVGF